GALVVALDEVGQRAALDVVAVDAVQGGAAARVLFQDAEEALGDLALGVGGVVLVLGEGGPDDQGEGGQRDRGQQSTATQHGGGSFAGDEGTGLADSDSLSRNDGRRAGGVCQPGRWQAGHTE